MDGLPNFITHGGSLRTLRAREGSAMISPKVANRRFMSGSSILRWQYRRKAFRVIWLRRRCTWFPSVAAVCPLSLAHFFIVEASVVDPQLSPREMTYTLIWDIHSVQLPSDLEFNGFAVFHENLSWLSEISWLTWLQEYLVFAWFRQWSLPLSYLFLSGRWQAPRSQQGRVHCRCMR